MTKKDNNKICFVVSPIGEEGSETRERADQVLKHIISTSVEPLGYTVIRADKISEPGIITTQIIEHIVDSDLVIADLTEKNPNVFYELAVRHAIRKPLVQLIRKGDIIPFDVAATRIIQFDLHNLDSVAAAREEISSQVKSLENGNNDVHNPISVSLDLKVLKESGNIEERSLADIVEAISDLRLAVSSSEKSTVSSKVLEEIRTSIDNISLRIENRFDPDFRRRKRRIYPMMLDEIMHMGINSENPKFGFLMLISLLKDDFPWIYEIGIETYRELKVTKTKAKKITLIEDFEKALEMMSHPGFREMYGKSEDLYIFGKEVRHLLHRYLEKGLLDTDIKE